MGGIKKPDGKKLLSGFTQGLFLQPNTIIESQASQPAVVLRIIADPSYKILPTAPPTSRIDNVLNEKFFEAVQCENWSRMH